MPSRHALCLFAALLPCIAAAGQEPEGQLDRSAAASYAGFWEVRLVHAGESEPLALLEISIAEGRLQGAVLDSRIPHMQREVKHLAVEEGQIRFVLDLGAQMRFRGKLVNGQLTGSIGSGDNTMGWVGVPTRATSLPGEPEDEIAFNRALGIRSPAERRSALKEFLSSFPQSSLRDRAAFAIGSTIPDPRERLAALEQFVADYPLSGLRDLAYQLILETCLQEEPFSEKKLLQALESYLDGIPEGREDSYPGAGGRRARAYHMAASLLVNHELLLGKAVELLEKAVARTVADEDPAALATYLTTLGEARYHLGEFAQAERSLVRAISLSPLGTSGQAHLLLGKTREAQGETDAALESYLAAASSIHGPELKSALERVYLARHGNLEGLHERVDAALMSRPKPFSPGRFERPSSGGREKVVLAELFTGAECGPCVAADLAFEGILERFDRKTVAILAYHLHVPGPDPMTNTDTEARAAYYAVTGTPTVVLDGVERHLGGGFKERASSNFKLYSEWIERRVESTPPVRFNSLSLARDGKNLSVSGKVEVREPSAPGLEKAGLHLVLAEELVHYTGGNGVHFHHFVVRKILTPADGLELPMRPGVNPFSHSVNLGDVEQSLRLYLAGYRDEREEFAWAGDLHAVDPRGITVVAFVQDRETREVLQASFVR